MLEARLKGRKVEKKRRENVLMGKEIIMLMSLSLSVGVA
jgi:hypothetical protein